MAWIELHQTLPTHRKTQSAADLLNMAPVHFMGHLVAFWLWALDNAPDGNISTISAKMIARAAQWEGTPDTFVDALVAAGFVNRCGNTASIHDWDDYAGKLISRRAADRERKNPRRGGHYDEYAGQAQDVRSTSAGIPQEIHRNSAGHPQEIHRNSAGIPQDIRRNSCATVPYPTVQYTTKENTCASADALESTEPPARHSKGRAAGHDPEDKPSGEQRAKTPFKSLQQQKLFEEFWAQYPKKRSKGDAEKAWVKLSPAQHLVECIMASLTQAKRSPEWTKDGGQYVPYPASWLNAKGWEDEYRLSLRRGYTGHIEHTSSSVDYDAGEIILRRIKRHQQEEEEQALESVSQ